MGIKCGIVGLPNVGKSTLFNALTKAGIQAENYPFCTIEPNIGVVPVPDQRLAVLADIVKPQQIIPAIMEFVDIAGLVAGASHGEGLGNRFLANIRETDAVAHVVRCFEDSNIIHVADKIEPISDIEVINTELALADLETVEKAITRVSKLTKSGDKVSLAHLTTLEKIHTALNSGTLVRSLILNDDERAHIYSLHLLTSKPVFYLANVAENGFMDNPYLDAVREFATEEDSEVVPVCAVIEAELVDLEPAEATLFLAEMGLEEPGLNRVIRAGYRLLGLHTYFTAGVKEVRAWTIRTGATAPQAASVIHTDFERGFICAEVATYQDFVQHQGEQGAKEAGKLRLEGKEYVVNDGDIIHFRFNV